MTPQQGTLYPMSNTAPKAIIAPALCWRAPFFGYSYYYAAWAETD